MPRRSAGLVQAQRSELPFAAGCRWPRVMSAVLPLGSCTLQRGCGKQRRCLLGLAQAGRRVRALLLLHEAPSTALQHDSPEAHRADKEGSRHGRDTTERLHHRFPRGRPEGVIAFFF